MPINAPVRTIDALCCLYAQKPEFAITSYSLSHAIKSKLPEAELIHGFARCQGEVFAYSWLRIGSRDFDVCYKALLQRHQVSKSLKCTCECPAKRELLLYDPADAGTLADAIVDWVLPQCAACCGKQKRHTLDQHCCSPWKAELLTIRKRREGGRREDLRADLRADLTADPRELI